MLLAAMCIHCKEVPSAMHDDARSKAGSGVFVCVYMDSANRYFAR